METSTKVESASKRLKGARWVPSPNFNERPEGGEVNLLVIHCISLPPGEFSGDAIEAFFQNRLDMTLHPYFEEIKDLKVSSHLLIRRDGEIIQFVSFDKRAWHAGESTFEGRVNCNDFSIGIELEGTETVPYTEAQYVSLMTCTKLIQSAYPKITTKRIVGHSDIAPNRKEDPGPSFDWAYFRSKLS